MAAPAQVLYPLVQTVSISAPILPKPTATVEKTQKGFKVGSPSEKDQKCQFPNCSTEISPALSLVTCACKKVFCQAHRKPAEHRCPNWKIVRFELVATYSSVKP